MTQGDTATLLLEQEGLAISAVATAADLAWLAEFMGPGLAASPGASPHVRVSLSPVPASPAPGAGACAAPIAFAFDSAPIRLPAEPTASGVRLFERDAGITFDVAGGSCDVAVHYSGSVLDGRVRFMRVIREYFHNHAVQGGRLVLHAAAVVHNGRALAIAGRKGAGKTSLMMHLLERSDSAFLANDRVLVNVGLLSHARGVPTIVSVREGTLRLASPQVASCIQEAGDYREHAWERAERQAATPVTADGAVRLSGRQLCNALQRPMAEAAPLSAIIFVDGDEPMSAPLRRLEPASARFGFAESLIGARSGAYRSEVFVPQTGSIPDRRALDARCAELALSVPCYAAGHLPRDAADWIEAILDCTALAGA